LQVDIAVKTCLHCFQIVDAQKEWHFTYHRSCGKTNTCQNDIYPFKTTVKRDVLLSSLLLELREATKSRDALFASACNYIFAMHLVE
jgi:hypothetical protein